MQALCRLQEVCRTADSVLYFPMIRPPENEWFSRVLFYWDRIGTILPREYSADHDFLRPTRPLCSPRSC